MKDFKEKKDVIEPTYIWGNGCKMIETEFLAWEIQEIFATQKGYQYLYINAVNSFLGDDDVSFYYYRLDKRLSINGVDFYVETLKEASKIVLSFLRINEISLEDKIYVTPNIKTRLKRIKKINRLI